MTFIRPQTFIATFVLFAYLALGSFLMVGMMDHHDMVMGGCPFMPGEQSMCQMNAFDHITAWQSMFTGVLPTVLVLALIATTTIFFWRLWYPPPDSIRKQSLYHGRAETVIIPLYQELFSKGILNPKTY